MSFILWQKHKTRRSQREFASWQDLLLFVGLHRETTVLEWLKAVFELSFLLLF